MKKVHIKLIISVALIIVISLLLINNVFAVNPDDYDPNPTIETGVFLERAGIVLGWIQFLGISVGILGLAIIGIKYIFSSVEGKAEYKKAILPYVIGCFMVVGISLIIGVIGDVASTGTTHKSGGSTRTDLVK